MPLVLIKSDPRARLRPCLRCGYSLRNVPDARVCPECGLAVWLSLSGNDDLEMSNPQWLGRVATGTLVLAGAHVLLALGVVALLVYHAAAQDGRRSMFQMSRQPVTYVCAAYLALCGAGLLLLGSNENRVPERARRLRRIAAISGADAIAIAVWIAAPIDRFHVPMFIALFVAAGQAVAGWAYVEQLALRIPSRRLATFAKYLWIAVAVAFASALFRGFFWLTMTIYMPWWRMVIGWTLFLIAYPPLAAALFVAVSRRFSAAAKGAAKNWEAEAAT